MLRLNSEECKPHVQCRSRHRVSKWRKEERGGTGGCGGRIPSHTEVLKTANGTH